MTDSDKLAIKLDATKPRNQRRIRANKDVIVLGLEAGNNITDACILAGISRETYYRWLQEDDNFIEEVEFAERVFKFGLIETIKRASNRQWQAAAWLLERKYKEQFSLRTEVSNLDGEKPDQVYILPNGNRIIF